MKGFYFAFQRTNSGADELQHPNFCFFYFLYKVVGLCAIQKCNYYLNSDENA